MITIARRKTTTNKLKLRKARGKRRGRKSADFLRFNIIAVPITAMLFLGVYFGIQGIAERLKIAPVIILGAWEWMTVGEAVLLFLVALVVSMIIALNFAYYLITRARLR